MDLLLVKSARFIRPRRDLQQGCRDYTNESNRDRRKIDTRLSGTVRTKHGTDNQGQSANDGEI